MDGFSKLKLRIDNIFSDRFDRLMEKVKTYSDEKVKAILKRPFDEESFIVAISSQAEEFEDLLIERARQITQIRFGNVINLYVPLYLSSYCINDCSYCFFGSSNDIKRKVLTEKEVEATALKLYKEGFRSILLVAGEDMRFLTLDQVKEAIRICKSIGFAFVSVEIGLLSSAEYRSLADIGLDHVTIYQETYSRNLYNKVHGRGPKSDYDKRIEAPSKIAEAGIRSVGIGFLLGLGNYRQEALSLLSHLFYLQKEYWEVEFSVSFPRLREIPQKADFMKLNHISDQELIRLVSAIRIISKETPLVISTRESRELRDKIFGVGITTASAGSKTSPGGYIEDTKRRYDDQFPVVDDRSLEEVIEAISIKGFDYAHKNWDHILRQIK